MRINVEYQFSDRNYTRFVTYFGASHERKTWSLGAYVYSENDVKNQPLQQNLSAEQAQVLKNAGDDQSLMTAQSAYVDSYSENKILYKKTDYQRRSRFRIFKHCYRHFVQCQIQPRGQQSRELHLV